jgi:hypothetical protein
MVAHQEADRPYKPSRADNELWQALMRFSPHPPQRTLDGFLKDKNHGLPRSQWQSAIAYLDDFVAEIEPVRHADEDWAALVNLALRCLASDMTHRGVEITPKRLIEQLPRIYTAIDNCFPGYRSANLLHHLIRLAAE